MVSPKRTIRRAGQVLAAITLLGLSSAALADFTVQPDRNRIAPGSAFELELRGEGDFDGSPDIEPLKKHFDVLSRRQSSQTRCVNFDCTTAKIITLRLMPKSEGEITVPALDWDGQQSEPVTVRVEEAAAGQSPVTVELLIDNPEPYVQEQVILTIRARSSQRFARGQFSGFKLPDDIISHPIDREPNTYTSRFNNVSQQVVEQRFALFPQKSGELTLPPVQFQAHFASGQRDMFGQRQYALRQFGSKSKSLEVQPRPADAPSPWLPAKQLSFSHYLSEDSHQVGQPVTLSLSSIGDGVLASQLPDIQLPDIDGLKIYPDSPETENRAGEEGLTAKRVDKIALIPTRPGTFTLPAMTLEWWNTESDQSEQTTIGPIEFTVEGDGTAAGSDSANDNRSSEREAAENDRQRADSDTSADRDSENTTSGETAGKDDADAMPDGSPRLWQGLALLFLLLWLITMVVFLWRARRRPAETPAPADTRSRSELDLESLKSRIRQGVGAREAADLLARWGRQLPGQPAGLHAIAAQIEDKHPELANEIARLHRHLYAGDEAPWDASALASALEGLESADFARAEGGQRRRKDLPPLY